MLADGREVKHACACPARCLNPVSACCVHRILPCLLRHLQYLEYPNGQFELYDLDKDPHEVSPGMFATWRRPSHPASACCSCPPSMCAELESGAAFAPPQVNNIFGEAPHELIATLARTLNLLKTCRGATCTVKSFSVLGWD